MVLTETNLTFCHFRASMKKWFGNSAVLPLGLLQTFFVGPLKSPSSKLNMYTAENATATKEFVMNTFDDFLGELRSDLYLLFFYKQNFIKCLRHSYNHIN